MTSEVYDGFVVACIYQDAEAETPTDIEGNFYVLDTTDLANVDTTIQTYLDTLNGETYDYTLTEITSVEAVSGIIYSAEANPTTQYEVTFKYTTGGGNETTAVLVADMASATDVGAIYGAESSMLLDYMTELDTDGNVHMISEFISAFKVDESSKYLFYVE